MSETEHPVQDIESSGSPQTSPDNNEPTVKRSNRVRRAPDSWWLTNPAVLSSNSALIAANVALSFQNAIEGPHSEFFIPGIQSELAAHKKNGTWELILLSEGLKGEAS